MTNTDTLSMPERVIPRSMGMPVQMPVQEPNLVCDISRLLNERNEYESVSRTITERHVRITALAANTPAEYAVNEHLKNNVHALMSVIDITRQIHDAAVTVKDWLAEGLRNSTLYIYAANKPTPETLDEQLRRDLNTNSAVSMSLQSLPSLFAYFRARAADANEVLREAEGILMRLTKTPT